jgi:8-amino-7-oxononanoate synthase
MQQLKKVLDFVEENKLYPDLRVIEGGADPEVVIDGKKVLMFSSNNYLGLANHPALKQAAINAVNQYGAGSGGSRLLSGNLKVHLDAERALAEYKGGEDAIIYPCGYSANVGVISAVASPLKVSATSFLERKTIILSDELNHASIIDGCKLSGQEKVVYKHNDVEDLEAKLKKFENRRKLIITDGVFSMDGDIAPLDKIVALAKKYQAITMIDEAHATGMLGASGRGTPEHFGLKPIKDIDIVMGTCSKSLGAQGGYVVGSKDLIKYLRVASRSYMFSTAMTPATAASIEAAVKLISSDSSIREKMWQNVKYLKDGFDRLGFDTLKSQTQIIPLFIGSDENAIKFSRRLFELGIFGPCVRWPAVEKEKSRIRFTVMATHTKEHLNELLKNCEIIGKELRII